MKSNKQKTIVLSPNAFPVVGIGASAGGLDAFKKLLKAIPEDSGMAYVLVQHLDPKHESMLPGLLQKVTKIPVLEIADEIKVEPNHIYVIPSNKMMVANDGVLQLTSRPEKSKTTRNLPIDLFFTSLAEVHQSHAIGVVLSGTASDGTAGLKAIKDYGGITFAQDEASAAYESMPHSAVLAGVVDFILPPEKIPQKLLEITAITNGNTGPENSQAENEGEAYKQILSLLRIRKGTDFTYYKQTTIRRRILRRMALNKSGEPASYLQYIRENKSELDILYQDLLIPVTSFFRDKKSFDNLCGSVFPGLIKNKAVNEPLRIWIAGCSTGEEAYSIAICLKEFLSGTTRNIQIFATDISEPAIAKARSGMYTKAEIEGISPERLREFFTKSNNNYHIVKVIRDMCVFAVHNFLKDPPFGKMDCISCRNVLIYMEPYLQKKALTTFHYSLNPGGFLLLGKSETTSGVPELFAAAAKNDKLFSRKDAHGSFMHVATQRNEQFLSNADAGTKNEHPVNDFNQVADTIILNKYAPAGVIVNEAMDIVQFRGNTENYLTHFPGKPSHHLLKMAKNGLAFELRTILHKARKLNEPVIKENIPLVISQTVHTVSIEAIPLPKTAERYYLILFQDTTPPGKKLSADGNSRQNRAGRKKDDKDLRIGQLETELQQAREDMRSITEDQQSANEELQTANEELLSGSEELQSLNEELETNKEELQSTNEELTVVNHEIISLNEQVTDARDYAEAIVATIHEPLLVLDKNLRVKKANQTFYKTFLVNEEETEGRLIYDLGNKQWNIPQLSELLEKILPQKMLLKDFEVAHRFPVIGDRVMMLNARELAREQNGEKLILLAIEDITDRKNAQEIINKTGEHFRTLVKELPAAVYSCDAHGYINFYNDAAVKLWGRKPELGKERWCASWKIFKPDGTRVPLDSCPMSVAIKEQRPVPGEQLVIERPDGSRSVIMVYPQPEFDVTGKLTGAINIGFDITEQVNAQQLVKESERRYNNMFMQSPFAFAVLKGKDMIITFANNMVKEMWGNGTDIENKPLSRVVPGIANGPLPEVLDKVYTTGIPYYGYELKIALQRRGRLEDVYFNFVYQPYLEADENISGVAFVAYEVTTTVNAQKRIEESEQRFRLMAELLPQKVWTADANGNKNYFNQQWLDYSGLPYEDLKGWGWKKIIHPEDWENTEKAWRHSISTGQDYKMENRVRRKDGKYLWHLIRATALKDEAGNIIMWAGIKIEIQERVEQKELLETAVLKRTYELHEANEELAFQIIEKEKKETELTLANKELQAFTYVASHDLQEPLRKIQNFANRILEKEYALLSVNGKDYFTRIQSAAERMQQLIVDLLVFSQLNTAESIFENTDLNKIIEEVATDLKEIISEKKAILEVDQLCPASIIPFQFRQLMHNLISNALKFSAAGIAPRIIIKSKIEKGSKLKRVKLSLQGGKIAAAKNYCHIAVSDNGIGFDPEYRDQIFEVFQRLHGREEYAGTGIGLAIVKKIVERHDGFLRATGKPGIGSTFNIYIPVRQ